MYRGERFNAISHLIGAVLAFGGLVVLVVIAARTEDARTIVSCSIFGTTLLLLYTASTLFHSLRGRPKKIFEMLDHHAIYLHIAGSYTPFTLVSLNGAWGWSLFGVIWALAVVGITIDSFPTHKRRILPLVLYLVMGWLIVIAVTPLLEALSPLGFFWLLLGGLLYTVGVLFYAYDEQVQYFHGIWHLFVLAGSITHYFTVFYYVV